MTSDEIKAAVEAGIRSALADPEFHCRYKISPEDHSRQHQAMEKFIVFTARLDDLKWSVMKKLIAWMVIGAFGLMLFGAAVKTKVLDILTGG